MKTKLKSRKFLTALSGIITGICLIIAGEITEGTTAVCSSVAAYLIAEGYVDGKKMNETIKETLKEEKQI